MKKNVVQNKWKQIRGKVIEQWKDIADQDLDKIMDKREQLVELVQEKYGDTQEKAEQTVDDFLKKINRRPINETSAFRILAVFVGVLLTITVLGVLARRLTSA